MKRPNPGCFLIIWNNREVISDTPCQVSRFSEILEILLFTVFRTAKWWLDTSLRYEIIVNSCRLSGCNVLRTCKCLKCQSSITKIDQNRQNCSPGAKTVSYICWKFTEKLAPVKVVAATRVPSCGNWEDIVALLCFRYDFFTIKNVDKMCKKAQ